MSKNIVASVRDRLFKKSKESGQEHQQFLARYGRERFLYRLGASPVRDQCILKGATLLVVWMKEPHRSTLDVDLLVSGRSDETSVRKIMADICKVDCPEDGLIFNLDSLRISPIHAEQRYQGQRVKMVCHLGTARIPIQIDFGFGDVVTPGPQEAQLNTLIEGVPAPFLRVYPQVTSIAEKFDAMVNLGKRNSRMKDFYDIWALSEAFTFEGATLREAIQNCFERRGTSVSGEIPAALTSAFYSDAEFNIQWRDYRSEGTLLSPPPEAFEVVGERVRSFFAQIHASIVADAPFELHWPAGGPWQRWKPYPACKDSGVEWLGEIPAHWEVKRLGNLGRFSASGIDKNSVPGEPQVRMINYLDIYDNPGRVLNATRLYQIVSCPEWKKQVHNVQCGDIVFTPSSETPEDIGLSAVCTEDLSDIVYSYHVIRFRPNQLMDLKFKKYWCNNTYVLDQFSARCNGTTRQILTRNDFRSIRVVFPPLPEQRAIASFLDRETAKIDALVAKKERLIELLQEKRTALISHAVTNGLDPDAPLKDSGVEWLGEIPAHWEVKASRREFAIRLGKMLQPKAKGPRDSEIPYFKAQHVQWEAVRTTGMPVMWADPRDEAQYGVVNGDLLVCEGGEVGRAGIVGNPSERSIIQNALHRVRPTGTSNIRLLMYLLKHAASQGWFDILCNRATIAHFTSEKFGDLPIPIPPLPEQRAIAAFLDRETAKLDALIAKIQEAIDLLKEQRTALISAAVTGKIDVRGMAA